MIDMLNDVVAFHDRFNIRPRMRIPTPLHALPAVVGSAAHHPGAQRLDHLVEEMKEFMAAVRQGDTVAQADSLVDLVYVAIGTAVMMGLPWEAVWLEVHSANMRKTVGPDPAKQGIVKPVGWIGPDIAGAIAKAGGK